MTQQFYALCKQERELIVKRLSVDSALQESLIRMFRVQEAEFDNSYETEVLFNGDWKPDEDEILAVELPGQICLFSDAVNSESPLSFQSLNTDQIEEEGIKAIFTGYKNSDETTVLVQQFTPKQILGRKALTMFLNQGTFNHLANPALTLNPKIDCVIKGAKILFKSFHNIRGIFDMNDLYRSATDEDIDNFSQHACLKISDVNAFKTEVDQTCRKLLHAIHSNGVLDEHTASEVRNRAALVDLEFIVEDGKLVMPTKKAEIKLWLRFLHDDVYEAPLSKRRYVTNSKKAA